MKVHFVYCMSKEGLARHPLVTTETESMRDCLVCRLYEQHQTLCFAIESSLELLEEGKQIQASRALSVALTTAKKLPFVSDTETSSNE